METGKQYKSVEARFTPKRFSTLRAELKPLIGTVATFCYVWVIGEEDGGPYVGQWAFLSDDERFKGRWIPEEDLEILSGI